METTTEETRRDAAMTAAASSAVREIESADTAAVTHATSDGRPDPQWVRGRCPECGDDLVSNMYYIGGQGYLVCWECWGSLGENPGCTYRRVL